MGIANITNNILTDSGAVIGAANGVATLDSGGKIPVSQLPNSVMEFKGTWSAATNTPTLANGTGNAGDVYEVSAAGTVNFGAGGIAFALGDYVVYDGATWQYSSGQKGTVTSLTFSAPLSGGTITTSGTVSIPAATSSVDGYLKATDWVIFNGKQNALTNPVTGTGTTNYLPKFTGASTIGDSKIFDNGTNVLINSTTVLDTAVKLQVTSNSSGVTSFSSLADDVIFEHNTNLGLTFATPNTAIATIAFADPESNAAGVIQYSHVDNSMAFAVASTEKMRLDASGNLGLGVTPSAWGSTSYKAIQGNYGTSFTFDQNVPTAHIVSNAYNNGTNWIYQINAPASRYAVNGWTGEHIWYNAPSGTAGTAFSFTQAMTLFANGNLAVGTTTDAGYKLDVNGTVKFSGALSVGGSPAAGNSHVFYNTANQTSVLIKQTTAATNAALALWNNFTTGDNSFIKFFGEATATNRGGISFDRAGNRLQIYGEGNGLLFTGATTFSSTVQSTGFSIGGVAYPNVGFTFKGTINGNNDTWGTFQGALTHAPIANNAVTVGYHSGGAVNKGTYTGLSYRGYQQDDVTTSGTGTITTAYGLYISALTTGASNYSAYFAQNVGIGTTSPLTNLQVTNSSGELFRLTNTTGTERIHFYTRNATSFTRIGSQNAALQLFTEDVGYDMMLGTSNQERMRITSAGRIIINNSVANDSGDRNLTIQGSLSATLNDVASINLTQVWNGVAYPAILAVQQDLTYGNASGAFVLKTSYWNGSSVSTGERLRVTGAGNVLINTTTDSGYKFDVSGTGRFSGTLTVSTSSSPGLNISKDASTDNRYLRLTNTQASSKNWDLINQTNANSNKFVIYNATDNISAFELTTAGAAMFSSSVTATRYILTPNGTGAVYNIVDSDATFAGSYVMQAGGGSSGFGGAIVAYGHAHASKAGWITAGISASSGGKFTVNTQGLGGGTDIFVVQQNGNVGIGTSSPGVKLDVDGSINGNGIARFGSANEKPTIGGYTDNYSGYYPTITANNHGDFVFGSNLTINTDHSLNTTNAHSAMRGAAIVLGGNGYTLGTNSIAFFAEPSGTATAGTDIATSSARMLIANSGNVGIGTTSPSYNLSVASYLGVGAQGGSDIVLIGGGSGVGAFIQLRYANGTVNTHLAGNGNSLINTTYGNVIIGTTTDNGYKLQVNGTTTATNYFAGGSTYNTPNALVIAGDTNWTFGCYESASTQYWMQVKYYGVGDDNRGFRVFNMNGNTVDFRVNGSGNGYFRGASYATAFYESSDATIKTLIQDNYQTKGIESVTAKLYVKNGKEELGYYAQDLQDILPSAVSKGTDGLLSLSYREVHTAKIARLEKRVEELEQLLNLN